VLRDRVPDRRLDVNRRDDRLRDRSRVHGRAVQVADAVSRHAAVEAARAARVRDRLAEVRRLHADLRAPEPERARAQVPAGRRVQPVLSAAVVARRLDPRDDARRPRRREADGCTRGRAPYASRADRDAGSRHRRLEIGGHGPRIVPETGRMVEECGARGELVQGPDIDRFERVFAASIGLNDAVATSFGRMAFSYILRAFHFPPAAEVIVPALTCWGIPEMIRVGGLTPVPADVDPRTCHLDPLAVGGAVTDVTVALVPT